MFHVIFLISWSLATVVCGQQVGTYQTETHPKLTSQQCDTSGICTTIQTSVVLDSNWRWLHSTTDYTNCYTGNALNASECPDPVTCVTNCALDGADYSGTFGITSSGNALTLKFVTGQNVGSRVFLMANDTSYQTFNLLGQEFAFDVGL